MEIQLVRPDSLAACVAQRALGHAAGRKLDPDLCVYYLT